MAILFKRILPLLLLPLPLFAIECSIFTHNDTVVAQSIRFHDEKGNLSYIRDTTGTYIFRYEDEKRLTTIIYPNGITTLFIYDGYGNVTYVNHLAPDGLTLLSYRYEYDASRRRTLRERIQEGFVETTSYAYTDEGDLARVDYSSGDYEVYTYDEWGNRLTRETPNEFIQYEYDDNDRLLRAGDVRYFYDHTGNLRLKQYNGIYEGYSYDQWNLLEKIENGSDLITFTYDEEGDRIRKTGKTNTEYTPLPPLLGLRDRVRISLVYDGEIHYYCYADKVIASQHPHKLLFYLYDHPDGSVGATIDNEDTLVLLDFDAFGVPRSSTSPIGFNGEWYDVDTGLYYLFARYYDPRIGRFITPDRFDDHPYAYCCNDPVNRVDPLGLWSWGRPSSNEDLMGKSGRSSGSGSGSKGSGPKGGSPKSTPAPPTPPPNPPSSNPSSTNNPGSEPTVTLYSQDPSFRSNRTIPEQEAAKYGQSTHPREISKGHVMTGVKSSDGKEEVRGIYSGEKFPVDDIERAAETGTKSISWQVTEEQAARATQKQREDSDYNLFTHNCGDRAREVLEAADIEPPPKMGAVTAPSDIGKWIDEQDCDKHGGNRK